MDVSSEEIEIPVPLNSRFGHTHITHHHESVQTSIPTNMNKDTMPYNSKVKEPRIRYKECLKNHAAAMGGNVTDGCGEFMSSGGADVLEAFTCSVCHCHRNFHRKLIVNGDGDGEGEGHEMVAYLDRTRVVMGHGYPPRSATPPHQMMVPYNGSFLGSGSEEKGDDGGGMTAAAARPYNHHHHHQVLKKRFRTKFTQQQKEKMMGFAEKVGWKIQKEEESAVQQLCQEIGVKRRVLKVWMHNNKHNLGKNSSSA